MKYKPISQSTSWANPFPFISTPNQLELHLGHFFGRTINSPSLAQPTSTLNIGTRQRSLMVLFAALSYGWFLSA
jgi:hypothetical protein